MSEMVWKLENDPYLCDMQRLQSNACQHTPIVTMMPGTYHHTQKKKTPLMSFVPHKCCIESHERFSLVAMSSNLQPHTNLLPDSAVSCDHARLAFNI